MRALKPVTGLLLCLLAVCDLRTRRLPAVLLFGYLAAGLLMAVSARPTARTLIMSLLPGFLLTAAAAAAPEAIGGGDGLLVLGLGLARGAAVWRILAAAMPICGCIGGILWIKGKKKAEVPFAVCVFAAEVLLWKLP